MGFAKFHPKPKLKAPSSAFLISRYILRLGQAAQKQQRPSCPNRKMYLEIRRVYEWLLSLSKSALLKERNLDISKLIFTANNIEKCKIHKISFTGQQRRVFNVGGKRAKHARSAIISIDNSILLNTKATLKPFNARKKSLLLSRKNIYMTNNKKDRRS